MPVAPLSDLLPPSSSGFLEPALASSREKEDEEESAFFPAAVSRPLSGFRTSVFFSLEEEAAADTPAAGDIPAEDADEVKDADTDSEVED